VEEEELLAGKAIIYKRGGRREIHKDGRNMSGGI
jgi:hypothetical protein